MVNIKMDEASSAYEIDNNQQQQSNNNNDGQNGMVRSGDQANMDKMSGKVQYTIPGVLHFVQHEWTRFEMERAQWDVERAELQARIAFLQGERKGQENLKKDLTRRIKMLEYALKQERQKYHRLKYGTELDYNDSASEDQIDQPAIAPTDVDAIAHSNSNQSWKQGRQLLRQYLQEIGYADTILDVRQFRVRQLLGMPPDGDSNPLENVTPARSVPDQQGTNAGGQAKPTDDDFSSDDEIDMFGNMVKKSGQNRPKDAIDDLEAEEAMAEFNFLEGNPDGSEAEWPHDSRMISQMKEQYKKEAKYKKGAARPRRQDLQAMLKNLNSDDVINEGDPPAPKASLAEIGLQPNEKRPSLPPSGMLDHPNVATDIDQALGLGDLGLLSNVNEPDPMSTEGGGAGQESGLRKVWTHTYSLKSHYDCIRAMGFHPVEPLLITASEDGCMKLWDLQKSQVSSPNKRQSQPGDLEPLFTFRGHLGPILCLCMSPTGDACFSGSLDGTVKCWTIPSPNLDPYDSFDPGVLTETFNGHGNEPIWSVAYHSSQNRLISAGADGAVRMWEPGSGSTESIKEYKLAPEEGNPTSVDFVNTDPQLLLAGYQSSAAAMFDIETGKPVLNFESKEEHSAASKGQINQLVSHPTLPITITAHEDRLIRFFDNNTGKMVDCMVAHQDAVSCLSIDANGLYLLSGSHDSSIRLWNLENKTCIQDITAHRRKLNEAVHCVAFHPSRPLLASAGADGIVKVFI